MSGESRAEARPARRSAFSHTLRSGAADETASADAAALTLVESFIVWLAGYGERSYDPYDFWATRVGRRAKQMYYRRTVLGPLAVLPFVALDTFAPRSRRLTTSPKRFPIADAHFALGFFEWATLTCASRALSQAEHFLAELERSRCAGFEEFCWGFPFDWESRSGTFRAGTPLITTVPYAYEAFEAGYEAMGKPEYLQVMKSVARFSYEQVPATQLSRNSAAASYSPFDRTRVVNASSYRGYLLASAGRRFERSEWTSEARRNIAFVLDAQRDDGSWPYALTEGDEFVDNFHTCIVLKNLLKYWRIAGERDALDAVRRGYGYYRRHLLDEDSQPIPFAVRPRLSLHRRDLYDYAEGINLAVLLREVEPEAEKILRRLVAELARSWVLPDGHFVTRRLVIGRNTVPYHRWAQSQVFLALARYCGKGV